MPPRAAANAPTRAGRPALERASYWERSKAPLQVLCFLLPLLALHEAGSLAMLMDPDTGQRVRSVAAQQIIVDLGIRLIGTWSLVLPALLFVGVLLACHIVRRDPWVVSFRVVGLMAVETVVWTVLLLVLMTLVGDILLSGAMQLAQETVPAEVVSTAAEQAVISLGAGLYEELLFRLVLITAFLWILRDGFGLRADWAAGIAIGLSALLFAVYHNDSFTGTGGVDLARILAYSIAGVFFGVVFLWRGFGIVVAAHALYDIVVLVSPLLLDAAPEA